MPQTNHHHTKTPQCPYERVTAQVLEAMQEEGLAPWAKPWTSRILGHQKNLTSQRAYTGLNALVLGIMPRKYDYWLTYKQAQVLGLQVAKGEKATPIIGWFKPDSRTLENEDGELETRSYGLRPRTFFVFNLDQMENVPENLAKLAARSETPTYTHGETHKGADDLIAKQGATVQHGRDHAYYVPAQDTIGVPDRDRFPFLAEYYSTVFHELGHWTGHASRLARKEVMQGSLFRSREYSQEELVAEMTSVFVCAGLGIATDASFRNSAAYIRGWLKFLQSNPKAFVIACQQAAKAHKFLTDKGTKP